MSLTTDALRELVECGLTAEQILRVAEANAGAGRGRSAGAERQARYRARKSEQATPGDVTRDVTCDASPDTPLPLPSSPQTPQQPTPTPGKTTRPRKAPLAKPETDVTEQVWQAASKPSRDRSGRPALGKAVLAAIRRGATGEAMVASVRDHCRAQGEFAKGVDRIISGEHWRDHLGGSATAQTDGPVDPAVQARRMRRYADTGVWELGWGPMPPPKSEAA